ncbi:MAG TPA: DUF6600 domain-containing protein [Chthoniobacterales bacterium]|nr:DUF6600 domain-containing protein [Chthoniobacterales bacterium]
MKQILFAFAMLALVSPALPRADGAEIGIDFFYNNLSGGNWLEVDDYGYCWQPDVAVNDPDWRPYSDGYWAYTDVGWTWMSYEDFGWATYHYGRWARLADYGWVWVPGLEWGPAWVSWRIGGDYVGWAPLPPSGPGVVDESQPIDTQADVEFDIGPAYYNFCDVRYMGEPVLRHRILPVRQNVTCIGRTLNVTHITVANGVVYNYGPDINVVNERSSRPIQRLHLQREQNVDLVAAAKSGGFTKVQGNALVVAAPMKVNQPVKTQAPPKVKMKVQQSKMERGWTGIDPNEQTKLREKFKTEDQTKPSEFGAPGKTGPPITAVSPTAPPQDRELQGRHLVPLATTPPVLTSTVGRETLPTVPSNGRNENVQGENPNRTGAKNPTGITNAPTSTPFGERPHERKSKGSPSPTQQ